MKNILLALLTAPAIAHAQPWFEFEADVGGTAYTRAMDGLWVQDGFSHKLSLTAPAIEAGVVCDAYQTSDWGVSLHLDYAWLGSIHTQGLATTDANYNLATKTWRMPMPLANFVGSGHDQGFLLTVEPHYDAGGWRFGVEVGPYVHRATWVVDATNQVNYIGQAPGSSHFVDGDGWQLGYVVGASIEYRNFDLRYQYFGNGSRAGNPVPAIWTHAHLLTVGYKF